MVIVDGFRLRVAAVKSAARAGFSLGESDVSLIRNYIAVRHKRGVGHFALRLLLDMAPRRYSPS